MTPLAQHLLDYQSLVSWDAHSFDLNLIATVRPINPMRDDDDTNAVLHAIRRAKSFDTSAKPARDPETLIHGYELKHVIRKTLQGSVLLMYHSASGRLVAVKIALKHLVDSGLASNGVRICENVRNEARLMKYLSETPCPNVIQLLHYIEDADRHVLIMELAPCGELFDWVKAQGMVSDCKARHMFRGIVHGVAFLHDRSICHLDISLENVLLMADSTPKLCDLGLARAFQHGVKFKGDAQSRPGKLTYMSPEVYAGADFSGPASDVWSLGIVLFIIIFGFPPFEVASRSDVRYDFMMRKGLPSLLTEWGLLKNVSTSCLDLICAMLQPESSRITLKQVMEHSWMASSKAIDAPVKPARD